MNCPFCQHSTSRVVDSRAAGDGIRRRRECESCGKRYSTVERLDRRMPQVLKRDGRRQPFDLDKLRRGILVAGRKRPVTRAQIEAALARIENRLFTLGTNEVPSTMVGELVLDELRGLDHVAYLRFASVYQAFETPEQFAELLQPLLDRDQESA